MGQRIYSNKIVTLINNVLRVSVTVTVAASSSPIPTSSKAKEPQPRLKTLVSISPIRPVDRVRKTKADSASQTEREEPQLNETASGGNIIR